MRFLRDAIVTILVLAAVIWIAVYVRLRGGALSADAQPGALETSVAARLVRLSIPAEADRQRNPFERDANAWRSVFDHYADHCAVCHGRDGRGKTPMGENMYPKVPDLAGETVQRLSDGALFHIIQNGVRWTGMPAWKGEHSPDETWKLVSFIRKVPSLTAKDIEELEKAAHEESDEPDREKPGHQHKHPVPDRNSR